ncbi:hypothetical protein MLD38_033363 [Melastoma candidum]|uniref:Uncharacterized protein n=1 Tax=Melastoma candidum TaxID=119954 RepID=A0ACB9M960_9MYRT|nr:hypothetical protein MLD38_033363 [Melastoma candidum]
MLSRLGSLLLLRPRPFSTGLNPVPRRRHDYDPRGNAYSWMQVPTYDPSSCLNPEFASCETSSSCTTTTTTDKHRPNPSTPRGG